MIYGVTVVSKGLLELPWIVVTWLQGPCFSTRAATGMGANSVPYQLPPDHQLRPKPRKQSYHRGAYPGTLRDRPPPHREIGVRWPKKHRTPCQAGNKDLLLWFLVVPRTPMDSCDLTTKTMFQYHGCYWHVCWWCFPNSCGQIINHGQTQENCYLATEGHTRHSERPASISSRDRSTMTKETQDPC